MQALVHILMIVDPEPIRGFLLLLLLLLQVVLEMILERGAPVVQLKHMML